MTGSRNKFFSNKTYFHMKSFALNLASIRRFTATRKWPILLPGQRDLLNKGMQAHWSSLRELSSGPLCNMGNLIPMVLFLPPQRLTRPTLTTVFSLAYQSFRALIIMQTCVYLPSAPNNLNLRKEKKANLIGY